MRYWLNLLRKYRRLNLPLRKVVERVTDHQASLALERNFGETVDDYFARCPDREAYFNQLETFRARICKVIYNQALVKHHKYWSS